MSNVRVFILLAIHANDTIDFVKQSIESINNLIIPQSVSPTIVFCIDGNIDNYLMNLIDNSSTSRLAKIIIKNQVNRGLASVLNKAIQKLNLTSEDIIMRHDADDIMLPTRMETQLEIFNRRSDADVLSGGATKVNQKGAEIGEINVPTGAVYPHMASKNPIIHPSVMMRGDFFQKYGLYDENFKYAQDWELWARASAKGAVFYSDARVVMKFRYSQSTIRRRKQMQSFVARIAFSHIKGTICKIKILSRAAVILFSPRILLELLIKI